MARILIVDDEAQVRTVLRLGLETEGHEVLEAADGRAALRAVREAAPELIITDVLMPEADGVSFIKQLRDQGTDCRLLAMSGAANGSAELLKLMSAFGAAETLQKPFSIADLLSKVRALLPV